MIWLQFGRHSAFTGAWELRLHVLFFLILSILLEAGAALKKRIKKKKPSRFFLLLQISELLQYQCQLYARQ